MRQPGCCTHASHPHGPLTSTSTSTSPALPRLVNGTRDLLRAQAGLAHHPNYHEFCRLLGRLKANYQLSELVSVQRRAVGERLRGHALDAFY